MLHIDIPTVAEFKALAAVRSDACVSIYVPTSPLSDHARANRIATADLSYAAHAATAAAIRELIVDLDAIVPGVVSDIDGSVAYSTTDNAKAYNVIDEVAKRALCTGVVVITGGPGELSIYPRVPSRRRPIAKKS